ncbi:MAG: hypothetical protein IMW89_15695 [Ktedonobacteraceae bacterium]|nr:hypothetical protein [Ktedonobacteraceae bacterium]
MLDRCHARRCIRFVVAACIGSCLALFVWLLPVQASVHSTEAAASKQPELDIQVGFGSLYLYRTGDWTPVYVTVSTDGSAFKGTLSVSAFTGPTSSSNTNRVSSWRFEQPVTLPEHAHTQFTLNIPFLSGTTVTQGVVAQLRDEHGKVITTQTGNSGYEIKHGSIMIGTLTAPDRNMDSLTVLTLPSSGALMATPLDATSLPTTSTVLDNFDIIVLDDFNSAALSRQQLLALQTWVNNGGTLIEIGGPQWKSTLGKLPSALLPVNVSGTATLPAGTQLMAMDHPLAQSYDPTSLSSPLPEPVSASIATVRTDNAFSSNTTVLQVNGIPLMVQARQGEGVICYVAVDAADPALNAWSGVHDFWQVVLQHALGDEALLTGAFETYGSGPGGLLTHAGILHMVNPDSLPGPSIIIVFILGYALLLGPIRLLLVRKLKNPHRWSWPIILSMAAVFSLLSYELAFYQRSASITDNSISLVQINQGSSSAHMTTYSGIFVPQDGDFTLQIPGHGLAQPIASQYLLHDRAAMRKIETPAAINNDTDEIDLNLKGMKAWSLQYTTSEQDIQFQGSLQTHLALSDNRVVGTIRNTLNVALNDAYILLPQSFAAIGHLAAGETREISIPIYTFSPYSGQNIANAIADHSGLPSDYFPYTHNDQPQSDFERHIAMLQALEGNGATFPPCQGPCKIRGIINRGAIYITGGRVPNPNVTTYEPLLLTDAPATLIGWTTQPLTSDVTVNGWNPLGRRESFIQMPLNLDIIGSLRTPPNFITGQPVNVQSYDAQLGLAGVYTLTDGTITFELNLPPAMRERINTFTITIPDLWTHPFGPDKSGTAGASHIRAMLYNWQTRTWDTITLNQDRFTSTNKAAYIDPNGQIMLLIGNQDTMQGKLYFGRPTLQLS